MLPEHLDILNSYAMRACFVCGEFGPCKHRERDIEEAYIEAAVNRRASAPLTPLRKPAAREEVA